MADFRDRSRGVLRPAGSRSERLNSPNDLGFTSGGSLYFTDPPYGLPKGDDDPSRELAFNGVFRLANGKLEVVIRDLTRPNGIAFSPDYKTLYIADSDEKHKVWMRYDVAADGSAANGRVFADATAEKEDGVPDGMKVDSLGKIYGAAPGGIWVFSAGGEHLGTIKPPETPSNCACGDDWEIAAHHRANKLVAGQTRGCGPATFVPMTRRKS